MYGQCPLRVGSGDLVDLSQSEHCKHSKRVKVTLHPCWFMLSRLPILCSFPDIYLVCFPYGLYEFRIAVCDRSILMSCTWNFTVDFPVAENVIECRWKFNCLFPSNCGCYCCTTEISQYTPMLTLLFLKYKRLYSLNVNSQTLSHKKKKKNVTS